MSPLQKCLSLFVRCQMDFVFVGFHHEEQDTTQIDKSFFEKFPFWDIQCLNQNHQT